MIKRVYGYAGMGAVFLYISTIIVGGLIYPGYSHVSQDISQLVSTQSPIKEIMNPLFLMYNLLIVVFGIGLYTFNKERVSKLASLCVILIGILGVAVLLFPINTRGTPITWVGIGHITLVSVISLLTVVSDFLFWTAYRHTQKTYIANVSLAAGIGFLIMGPIAGINVLSPYAGLYERITIGIFLTWMLLISLYCVYTNRYS